jgi:hypothetical protein
VGLRRRGCRWIIWANGAYRRSWREERRRTRGLRGRWLQPTPTENASTSSRQGAKELRVAGPRAGERAATDVWARRSSVCTIHGGNCPTHGSHPAVAQPYGTRVPLADEQGPSGGAEACPGPRDIGKKENGPKVRARPK